MIFPVCSIAAALKIAVERLATGNYGRFEAEALLCHVLATDRSHLHAWPEQELSASQWRCFVQVLDRRAKGEPVAYIRGQQEFWSLDLQVTSATLIPRPETELLVELALQRIPSKVQWQGADLGTGSGAIALALASERPHVKVVATDISAAALEVAQENARRLGLANVKFQQGDWLAPLASQRFDFIVSNPPYVAVGDPHLFQGALPFEPDTALIGGDTGLEAIQAIAVGARKLLTVGAWLLLEHGYNQGPAALELLKGLGYKNVAGFSDLAGVPRAVVGQWPGAPAGKSR
jgi:release factor glutamine methyltransferase